MKQGRPFYYEACLTRAELDPRAPAEALSAVLQGDRLAQPFMSFFVQAVSERDRDLR